MQIQFKIFSHDKYSKLLHMQQPLYIFARSLLWFALKSLAAYLARGDLTWFLLFRETEDGLILNMERNCGEQRVTVKR
jgi:hypothetical protein